EVARDIRALDGGRWAAVPVIAMSAHVSADAVERYVGAGMARFLSKPFDRAQLARALAAATAGCADEAPRQAVPGADKGTDLEVLDLDYLAGELDSL
ncbi:response regulator, partial [Aromatoleum toluclasticum]|uniref:response regulator n=1 Tax=Aromatoleum toluclasticum TaxID=92003 RepID=UPI001D17EAE4